MKRSVVAVILFLAVAAPVLGCGEEKSERGLTPAGEVAAPESAREMSMTEEERREQEREEEARRARRLVDQGE
jgi:hypothetical protein